MACLPTLMKSNVADNWLLRKAVQLQEAQSSGLNQRKKCLSSKDLETKYSQRAECASQIHAMSRYFDYLSPAVFASSVAIMDSALIRVNIPWKYLTCFSAACFLIGSKWIEDDDYLSLSELVDLHWRQWKEVDLRRMEERVLQVLGWQLPRCTYLHFLPHLIQLMASPRQPYLPSPPPTSLFVRNAEQLLMKEFSFLLKPAAVALGAVQYTLGQYRSLPGGQSSMVLALQDFLSVMDSELSQADKILTAEDQTPCAELKSNKAYFPKEFETPYKSFCPDYRLYKITEEVEDDSEEDVKPVHRQPSSDSSISDYDCSGDVSGSSSETSMEDSCEISPDCDAFRDNIQQENSTVSDTASMEESMDHETLCEEFSCMGVESSSSQNVSEQATSGVLATTGSVGSDGRLSREESHDDSGCEDESDAEQDSCGGERDSSEQDSCGGERDSSEQDSCGGDRDSSEQDSCAGERDSSEQDACSEHDSSELDSGYDPDSDFNDSSPCRVGHIKACVDAVQRQALTFN